MGNSYHSRGYHHYFEGYTEATKVNAKGKSKVVRIYTGVYHVQDLPQSRRILLRVAYVLMLIMAIVLFSNGAMQNVGSNQSWYVVVPEIVAIAGIFWMFCTMVIYLTSPRKLTIHDYKTTSGSLKKASMTATAGLASAAVLTVLYILLHLDTYVGTELYCFFCLLLSAALCGCIYFLERSVKYREEQSTAAAPQGGVVID